jgi:hypothetical protein
MTVRCWSRSRGTLERTRHAYRSVLSPSCRAGGAPCETIWTISRSVLGSHRPHNLSWLCSTQKWRTNTPGDSTSAQLRSVAPRWCEAAPTCTIQYQDTRAPRWSRTTARRRPRRGRRRPRLPPAVAAAPPPRPTRSDLGAVIDDGRVGVVSVHDSCDGSEDVDSQKVSKGREWKVRRSGACNRSDQCASLRLSMMMCRGVTHKERNVPCASSNASYVA